MWSLTFNLIQEHNMLQKIRSVTKLLRKNAHTAWGRFGI